MILRYGDVEFEFDCPADGPLSGRLRLSEEQRDQLKSLLEAELEDWYLSGDGERLPTDQLFSLSLWSCETSSGLKRKLLQRFVNLETGEALFSTHDTYDGETFGFLRQDSGRA